MQQKYFRRSHSKQISQKTNEELNIFEMIRNLRTTEKNEGLHHFGEFYGEFSRMVLQNSQKIWGSSVVGVMKNYVHYKVRTQIETSVIVDLVLFHIKDFIFFEWKGIQEVLGDF